MQSVSAARFLAELIAIDSQVTKSNRQIIEYLDSLFSHYERKVYPCRKGDLDLYNLVVRVPGRTPGPALIFAGHTDTVPVNPSWVRDPFKASIEDERLYGLGAADMKAGLAAAIAAVLGIADVPPHDVYLMFTADEEDAAVGVKHLVSIPEVQNSMRGANIIVGESNQGRVGLGCRGYLGMRIVCHGEAFHSARTNYTLNMEQNANYIAYRVMGELIAYEQTLHPTSGELALQSSQNIGIIQGGTAQNTIADRCIIEVSRRLPATEKADEVFKTMSERVMRVDPRIEIEVTSMDDPYEISPDNPLVQTVSQLCREIMGSVETYRGTGWNEGAVYSRFGNTVVLGPGTSGTAHQPDEWTDLKLLDQVTGIYRRLIELKVAS